MKDVVNTFLSKADLGISSFDFVKREIPSDLEFPKDIPLDIKEKFIRELSKKEVFFHKSDFGGLVEFDKELESRGT
jgi:hypothetical protein